MASSLQSKRKNKRRKNGLPNGLLARLQLVITLDEYPPQLTDDAISLLDSYSPSVFGSCTLRWYRPRNPLNVAEYRRSIRLPGQAPYLALPVLPCALPPDLPNARVIIPTHPSILPLLLAANYAGVNVQKYDIVSERNSIRQVAMNNEDYVISVIRLDSTLFLRRYPSYHSVDKNDTGFRFERLCTKKNGFLHSDHYQLVGSRVGEFQILMLCETDALQSGSLQSVELKCSQHNPTKAFKHEWWLQAFLSKMKLNTGLENICFNDFIN